MKNQPNMEKYWKQRAMTLSGDNARKDELLKMAAVAGAEAAEYKKRVQKALKQASEDNAKLMRERDQAERYLEEARGLLERLLQAAEEGKRMGSFSSETRSEDLELQLANMETKCIDLHEVIRDMDQQLYWQQPIMWHELLQAEQLDRELAEIRSEDLELQLANMETQHAILNDLVQNLDQQLVEREDDEILHFLKTGESIRHVWRLDRGAPECYKLRPYSYRGRTVMARIVYERNLLLTDWAPDTGRNISAT